MTTGAGTRLEAVVLAAGAGRRFGGRKLLAPWQGGVLLDGALSAAFAAPARTVTVVTGADAGDVAEAAERWAAAHGKTARLRLVHAADHAEGMGASLRTGIAALPADSEGAFVFLGDMPRVPAAIGPALAAALIGADAAAPVFDGKRGHPALLGNRLFEAVRALGGDEGARAILGGLGKRLALVIASDNGVLFDVDTPEALGAGED